MTMPLIVMILCFVFVGIMAGCALKQFVEQRRTECRQNPIISITRPLAALDISLAFDADHAILWDTQMPALELIATGNHSGIHKHGVLGCYRKLAHSYPELYEGSTCEQWLGHLEQAHLIVCSGDRLVLAPEGRVFLRCRVTVPQAQL